MKTIDKAWSHPDAQRMPNFKFKSGHESPLVKVSSIYALNQIVGYVKFLNKDKGHIFFRGQPILYDTLLPSIYRGASRTDGRNAKIAEYIRAFSKQIPSLSGLGPLTTEALLQHYGLKTRWIDLVDNLWIALWFAIHEYNARTHEVVYEKVIPKRDMSLPSYLILVFSDALTPKLDCPGILSSHSVNLIDLRKATPSIFLRPHCQHALLMKSSKMDKIEDVDLSKYVALIIELNSSLIKDWLGTGKLVTTDNIFPSPVYDHGYAMLLDNAPTKKEEYKAFGTITHIS